MLFKDQLAFVMQHIKKNRLRVFMTVLAATMGCAFLIVLASVGFGMHKTIEDDILSDENVTRIELMSGTELTAKDIEKIEQIDHVVNVRTKTQFQATVQSFLEDREGSNSIVLTDFTKYEAVNDELSEGRFPTKPTEIVVGYHFGQYLLNDADNKAIADKQAEAEAAGTWYDGAEEGYKDSLIGKAIDISITPHVNNAAESEKQTFTIVGVLPAPAYEWATDTTILMADDNKALLTDLFKTGLPTDFTEPVTDSLMFTNEMMIFAEQLEYVAPILETLRDDGYQVYSITEQLKEVNVVFSIVKIGLVFVGTIAILIASIGIFNTMTMAVTERTREIGVLKAIGASPKLIQRLFLMESAFIGIIGTVIAIAISYVVSFAANALMPVVVSLAFGEDAAAFDGMVLSHIPWELVLLASAISLGVAILSGWRPARKATRIEVMQALRQEL